jgi:hypothetical protein
MKNIVEKASGLLIHIASEFNLAIQMFSGYNIHLSIIHEIE